MKDSHIFFLFFHLGLGGVQRKMVDFVQYIDSHESCQRVIPHLVLRRDEEFNLESALPKKFKLVHIENLLRSRESKLRYLVFLAYLVLEYNPKVLVPFLHQAATYCILIKYLFFWKKIRVVISQDNVLSLENRPEYTNRIHSNAIIGWCYRRADAVISQTDYAKQDLIDNYGVPADRVFVIQNWTKEVRLFRFPKMYDLIYCGRFAPQKKLVRLLIVLKLIKKEIPQVNLCLIGSGPEERRIRRYIKTHDLSDNVIIKPPMGRIVTEIARSKLFTLTSDFEGHPLVLLEAMAQQVVPVTLRYPGVTEYLNHGVDGFTERSQSAMAKRIIYLLRNRKQREIVGRRARRVVLKNHDETLIDKTLNKLLDF